MAIRATVAIVGRPNVGKSTLFNRLVGRRQAIVHDLPGVTRDRVTARTSLGDHPVHLIDTGGLQMAEDVLGLNSQVFLAAEESDLLLFVVDGKDGSTAADEEVWQALRRYGKNTVLVVNKGDVKTARENEAEFFAYGISPQVLISAEHGLGLPELHAAAADLLPEAIEETDEPEVPSLAIVGRPNVGKSSLLNRFVGSERALVSPVAGTTRDPVDSLLTVGETTYRLVDTAGIRRRSQMSGDAEELAVMMARRQLERAELALLVIDAAAGITTGDLAIAGAAWDMGRALVVLVNKWDLIDDEARKRLDDSWPRLEELAFGPERVNVSAETRRGVEKVFPAVARALEAFRAELSTSEVNRLFQTAVNRHQAPAERGKPWNLLYATQVKKGPPTFVVFANRSLRRASPYRRYLENFLRRQLGLHGVPIHLKIKVRSRRGGEPKVLP
ncbi:MAG: ribosome biogenesis GTPase Der [Thermoanaerobaculia bacterium]